MTKETKQEIEKTGIHTAESRNEDREMTRSIWLEEVFPEWQCILNKTDIEKCIYICFIIPPPGI